MDEIGHVIYEDDETSYSNDLDYEHSYNNMSNFSSDKDFISNNGKEKNMMSKKIIPVLKRSRRNILKMNKLLYPVLANDQSQTSRFCAPVVDENPKENKYSKIFPKGDMKNFEGKHKSKEGKFR